MTATTSAPATVKSVNFTNNQEAREALRQFKEAKAEKKAAEKKQAEAEAILRQHLGGALQAIILGVVALKVSSLRTRVSIDAKLLKEAYPDAYDATKKESTYDFLQES